MGNKTTLICRRLASTLSLALLAAGCAPLPPADLPTDFPEERAQIERRLHEVLDAAESKDFARLHSYHLYGPKFTKFTGSSPERLDATAGREGEHAGLGAVQGLKMRANGLQIDIFGKVGIATFILDYSFDSGGARVQKQERSTLVFVKDRGAWKIAHEHLSPIKL